MRKKDATGRGQWLKPTKQLGMAGVPAEAGHFGYLGADGNFLAEQPQVARAVLQGAAAGAFGHEAAQDNGVAIVVQALPEMMKDPSTGHHAGGGDNYGGTADVVDAARFFGSASEAHMVEVEFEIFGLG